MSAGPTSAASPTPVGTLIPHARSMRLLREVVRHDSESTACRIRVTDSALFEDDEGRVPSWVGLEYMAQCIAVDGALRRREVGSRTRAVLLLGARSLSFETPYFEPEQVLEVEARWLAGNPRRAAFACAIRDPESGRTLAEGRLSVVAPSVEGEPRPAEAPGGA